jgi:hypothetical protein
VQQFLRLGATPGLLSYAQGKAGQQAASICWPRVLSKAYGRVTYRYYSVAGGFEGAYTA